MVTGHPRRLAAALSLLAAAALAATGLTACGSPGGTQSSEGASCAAESPSVQFASAQIVFVGVMLPGPAVQMGQGDVLTSPARVRVERYLKGGGPPVVTVITGVTSNASGVTVAGEGIQATAGQRWKIYTTSSTMPYDTSVCGGSAPVAGS